MRLPSPPRIPALTREDKEAKLKDFISDALAAGGKSAAAQKSGTQSISLVARAVDSPVATALLAMAADIAAAGIAIRVILFETETLSEDSVQPSLLDVGAIEVRVLNDQRFASAHEQLSLGNGHTWIGDCMRRDPSKRDAFEMYHVGLPAISAHADTSFAKLWQKSAVVSRVLPAAVPADVLLAGQPVANVPPVSTRR